MRARLQRLGVLLAIVLALPGMLAMTYPEQAMKPGDGDLYNFEHVYNFNFNSRVGPPADDNQGTDLVFFSNPADVDIDGDGDVDADDVRDYAVVGDHGHGAWIFDITDGDNVEQVGRIRCAQPRSDPGVQQYVDGDGVLRTIVSLSNHGSPCKESGPAFGAGVGGAALFDVTDPANPTGLVGLRMNGVHNFVFHPTELIGYSWTGALTNPIDEIPMVDLRGYLLGGDAKPEFTTIRVNGGPHDGEFNAEGDRLYVAQQHNYAIYDTTDPLDPQLISLTGVAGDTRAPGATANPGTYAHGVWPSHDGEVMITNNESLALGGFFVGGSGVCPGEGLGFYLIGGELEAAPVGPVGYFAPPVVGKTDKRACTSHFGTVSQHTRVMTVGWYIAGSRVVDFSDPYLPREIGAAVMPNDADNPWNYGSEVWAAKTYKDGYMYVGDMRRGFDVFKWTGNPDCPAPWQDGWTPDCEEGRTMADTPLPRAREEDGDVVITGTFSCRLIIQEQAAVAATAAL